MSGAPLPDVVASAASARDADPEIMSCISRNSYTQDGVRYQFYSLSEHISKPSPHNGTYIDK
eukprot:909308-Prorocentrum_lima.AAC.1